MGPVEAFLKGMAVTGRQFIATVFGKGLVTTKYPEVMREKPQRFHGRHVLNRYEDGMEKCIGCELCAGACPARCIYVRGADNPRGQARQPRGALRVRLRDQHAAVHLLRAVRRGLSHRGHHPHPAVRDVHHQPGRRHLHQDGTAGRSGRASQPHVRHGPLSPTSRNWPRRTVGCGPPRPRAGKPTRGRVDWSGSAGVGVRPPEAGQAAAPEKAEEQPGTGDG